MHYIALWNNQIERCNISKHSFTWSICKNIYWNSSNIRRLAFSSYQTNLYQWIDIYLTKHSSRSPWRLKYSYTFSFSFLINERDYFGLEVSLIDFKKISLVQILLFLTFHLGLCLRFVFHIDTYVCGIFCPVMYMPSTLARSKFKEHLI